MSAYKSQFLQTLDERGFIHQVSAPEGLDDLCTKGPITGYIGFDCTADSFHVGNLVQVMLLYWLQHTGNRPIFLMGSGTTRIGDPSGKTEMRKMLSPADIENNKTSIIGGVSRLLDFGDGATDAIMADNAEWLLGLKYVDFLRDYGRHFSVNQMIQRDSVRTRLEREQHLSLLEFNYMVFQAYDFVELYRRYGCILQMGGSDQWGNIVSGLDLGRRSDNANLFALTTPLITTASGAKMGKTAGGAVWLNADRRGPYEYWQFWRDAEDADVGRFLKLFTTMPLAEIARLDKLEGVEINEAKIVLATEATALLHGREAAERAQTTARATFERGAIDLSLPGIDISRSELDAGIGVLAACVKAGLAASNSEARRYIKSGALKVNDGQVSDERAVIDGKDLLAEGVVKLSVGKKRHALLRVT